MKLGKPFTEWMCDLCGIGTDDDDLAHAMAFRMEKRTQIDICFLCINAFYHKLNPLLKISEDGYHWKRRKPMSKLYEVEYTEIVTKKIRTKLMAGCEEEAFELVESGSYIEETVINSESDFTDWSATEVDE